MTFPVTLLPQSLSVSFSSKHTVHKGKYISRLANTPSIKQWTNVSFQFSIEQNMHSKTQRKNLHACRIMLINTHLICNVVQCTNTFTGECTPRTWYSSKSDRKLIKWKKMSKWVPYFKDGVCKVFLHVLRQISEKKITHVVCDLLTPWPEVLCLCSV